MKLFFDTNVIISGFVTKGYSFDVIKDAIYKRQVYYTAQMLTELQRILPSKFSLSDDILHFVLSIIKKYFIKAETSNAVDSVCRDADDDQLLADALANGIELIITGDKDLLILEKYKGIRIISPKEYWSL